jgi:hypothetical protein
VVSELLHRVEKWWDTDVSEDHGASIIRVKWMAGHRYICIYVHRHSEDEDTMAFRSVCIRSHDYTISWNRRPRHELKILCGKMIFRFSQNYFQRY